MLEQQVFWTHYATLLSPQPLGWPSMVMFTLRIVSHCFMLEDFEKKEHILQRWCDMRPPSCWWVRSGGLRVLAVTEFHSQGTITFAWEEG